MGSHEQILNYIKIRIEEDNNPLREHLDGCSDIEIYRKLFKNFRSIDSYKGLQLTWLGLNIIKPYFQIYEIILPPEEHIRGQDLLYLDRMAKFPYYIQRGETKDAEMKILLFDGKLALMLKLADGKISNLRQMEK